MIIKNNVSFPHPVLGIRNDFLSLPDFAITPCDDESNYIYDITITLNNSPIQALLGEGSAQYVCEVNCRRTFYRCCTAGSSRELRVVIPKKDVLGEVSLVLTVNAVSQIDNYENNQADKDYKGYRFRLEPGDLLAYIGKWTFQTDINANEYKTVGSFIHFFRNESSADVSFDLTGQDIRINLPPDMFDQYIHKLNVRRFKDIVIFSIVKEAIVYALTQYSCYTDNRWARLLKSTEVLSDYDFEDDFDMDQAMEMTDVLLKKPYKQLFDTLVGLVDDND